LIHIYLENNSRVLSIHREESLPALESQVLEIFSKLNSWENSLLGIQVADSLEIKIQSYNKHIWKVENIDCKEDKSSVNYYSTQRVIRLIKDIFLDTNFI